jgi:uncharacterized lipoprotein YddW (UPF0748 family)
VINKSSDASILRVIHAIRGLELFLLYSTVSESKRMKLPLFCLTVLSLLTAPLGAQPEFRGAWVATVFNLDWPSKAGLPAEEQKAQLRAMLDRAHQLNLNAILLQVRSVSDACYASKREPWSAFLSGKQGVDPGYDPLAFAITEAHARGIELHAWFNPFRAGTSTKAFYAANHVTRTHPEWVRTYGGQFWLDPGEPEARRYILETILDVVKRYDIDGVHIDDYFYPYPVKGADFPDDATWQHYGQASGMARADWRRDNINRFVEAMYRGVKAAKPAVRVGISPFGIWRPKVPATIEAQLDSYAQLFADARHWLSEGWCDYLAPQLYWGIDPAKQSFPVLLKWWRDQSRAGRPVWPGIATERIGKPYNVSEIARQIALTRQNLPANAEPGNIQWSMKALMHDQGGVNEVLGRDVYGERAELPRR